jgi:iron complex outermembrane receptor protein
MLGQADMSLLPSLLADNVLLEVGNQSLERGSGGFGGAVLIENHFPKKIFSEKLIFTVGSFGTIKAANDIYFRRKKWHFRNRLFYEFAENNFPFEFQGDKRRQNNAQSQKYGQMTEATFDRNERERFSLKVWTQNNFRNLPPPMTVPVGHDSQKDDFQRVIFSHQKRGANFNSKNSLAFFRETLFFQNPVADISSKSTIYSLHQRSDFSFSVKKITFETNLQNALQFAESNAYSSRVQRLQTSFFAKAEKEGEKTDFSLMMRGESIDLNQLMLLPSVRVKHQFSRKTIFDVQIGLNGRFPTMNDLYWQPGGNPNLLPERGLQAQAACGLMIVQSDKLQISTKAVYFEQVIHNRIQWIPGFAGFWQPVNLKNVRSNGAECSIETHTRFGKNVFYANFQYALTRSRVIASDFPNDNTLGKQLIYTPLHNFKANFSFQRTNTGLRIDYQAYSRRYTDGNNSTWLLPYAVADLSLWQTFFAQKKPSCTLILQCRNITNAVYQSMAFYALPGRNFLLSVRFEF